MVYSAATEPLLETSFEEATDAPKAELALTIKDPKENKSTLVITCSGSIRDDSLQPQDEVIAESRGKPSAGLFFFPQPLRIFACVRLGSGRPASLPPVPAQFVSVFPAASTVTTKSCSGILVRVVVQVLERIG